MFSGLTLPRGLPSRWQHEADWTRQKTRYHISGSSRYFSACLRLLSSSARGMWKQGY